MKRFMWVLLALVSLCAATIIQGPEYYEGGEYYLLDTSTWTEAEAEAVSMGGHLVTVNSEEENTWVLNTFSPNDLRNLWIGYTDQEDEGDFEWTSGEPEGYTNWGVGEPNDALSGQDYTYIVRKDDEVNGPSVRGQWDDSANDGVPWVPSNSYYGVIEISGGTSEMEILYGPMNGVYSDNIYYLLSPGTWEESQNFCENFGGNLATVRDSIENQWYLDVFLSALPNDGTFWIGYSDKNVEGVWEWCSGETTTYTNWDPEANEPNGGTNENYASLAGSYLWGTQDEGEWNDNSVSVDIFYGIMEVPLLSLERITWGSIKASF